MPDPARKRRSIRLPGYDYTGPGGYYVTIVTEGMACLFGEIVGEEMHLSALGQIVRDEWFRSAQIRKEIRLSEDEFVVMPNHIHGIIWIEADSVRADGVRLNDGAHPVESVLPEAGAGGVCHAGARHEGEGREGARRAPLRRPARSLPSFVAGFKSAVAGRAKRELAISNVWHRNYYEHILRDRSDWERVCDYIRSNPSRWARDAKNPARPFPRGAK
jgi:putative transposase